MSLTWPPSSFRRQVSPHAVAILATPPLLDPLTIAEGKTAAGLDWSVGDGRDALMTGWIKAAVRKLETDTGIVLLTTAYDLLFDALPASQPVALPYRPAQSVTVSSIDTAGVTHALVAGDVLLDRGSVLPQPARVAIVGTWPTDLRAFQPWLVHLVAGFATVELLAAAEPALLHAVRLLVAHYATVGRDVTQVGHIITTTPLGYDDVIAPYVPVTLA